LASGWAGQLGQPTVGGPCPSSSLWWETGQEAYGWTPVFVTSGPHNGLVESYLFIGRARKSLIDDPTSLRWIVIPPGSIKIKQISITSNCSYKAWSICLTSLYALALSISGFKALPNNFDF
jgi:hypothetical protein